MRYNDANMRVGKARPLRRFVETIGGVFHYDANRVKRRCLERWHDCDQLNNIRMRHQVPNTIHKNSYKHTNAAKYRKTYMCLSMRISRNIRLASSRSRNKSWTCFSTTCTSLLSCRSLQRMTIPYSPNPNKAIGLYRLSALEKQTSDHYQYERVQKSS